jgi:predicted aminopeptidase
MPRAPLIFLALLPLLLSQCSTVRFYTQAASGQWEIQRKARPIEKVLADPATPAPLKTKLELVQEIRAYARNTLNLPAEKQYHRYTDLQRKHLVWVVFAAPEFSLKPHTWRYPFLGDLSYRGWFKEKDATALATQLRSRGLDVFVAEVDAYSTLGVLSDPILNTFIDLPPRDLAELLFHELTHQRLYLPNDTDFNEALATAVARHATRRWLADTQRTRELTAYNREDRILTDFIQELTHTRADLEKTYAQTHLTSDAKRLAKTQAFTDLRHRADHLNRKHGGTLKIDKWFAQPVNNARLNSIATYYDLVPAIDHLLIHHCQNNLETLLNLLKTTRPLTPTQRLTWLQSQTNLTPRQAPTSQSASTKPPPAQATH